MFVPGALVVAASLACFTAARGADRPREAQRPSTEAAAPSLRAVGPDTRVVDASGAPVSFVRLLELVRAGDARPETVRDEHGRFVELRLVPTTPQERERLSATRAQSSAPPGLVPPGEEPLALGPETVLPDAEAQPVSPGRFVELVGSGEWWPELVCGGDGQPEALRLVATGTEEQAAPGVAGGGLLRLPGPLGSREQVGRTLPEPLGADLKGGRCARLRWPARSSC